MFAALYNELHRIARREAVRYGPNSAPGATTLLHEAYLGMSQREAVAFPDLGRLLAQAARAMRRLVIDRMRAQRPKTRRRSGHHVAGDADCR